MNQQAQQEDFQNRVQELLAFAKEKEIFIGAVQQINKENGYIEVVPLYRNLKQYEPEKVVAEKTSEKTSEEK